jgi:hypothetical protein
MSRRKKAPPYARRARIDGENPTMYIFFGWESWERANEFTRAHGCIFPYREDPSLFEWAVKGCGVVMIDWSGDPNAATGYSYQLARVLWASGAEEVHYVNMTDPEASKPNIGG